MKRLFIAIALLLLIGPVAICQEAVSPDESLENGNFFYEREDYVEAVFHFLKLAGTGYENANIQFKIGNSYLNIHGEEFKAIPFLEKAIENMSDKYKRRSPTETTAPEYALFYLGNAYRINNQLNKALDTYNAFMEIPGFENKFNFNLVDNQIRACEKAKIIQDIPINADITNIGPPINSETANYSPVISSDETVLVYLSEQKFYNAILLARKEKGTWTGPENITPQVGSDGDVLPSSISADKQEIYLVKGEDDARDIYYTRFDGTFWTKMEPLNSEINSPRAETHACISPDGQTLYFTSNRRGGIGGLDVYKSTRQVDGDWGPAENLGPVINSEFDEETPFVSADESILYFSSQNHYNMGGFDVFYSILDNSGNWGTPINIGYPVNTTGDDLFYSPVGNGTIGYMAMIKPGGSGKEDIYRIEIFPSERTEITAVEGVIDLHGLQLNFEESFDIQVVDKASEKIVGIIHFNQKTGKLTYTSKSGNLYFKIERK